MSLVEAIKNIWPDALANDWIRVQDDGGGPHIPEITWNAQAVGMSYEAGLARITAYNTLALTRNGYTVSCTHESLKGQSVKIEVLKDGKVVGSSQKGPLAGNTVDESIIAPEGAGTYRVRFSLMATPYATGEMEVEF